MHIPTGTRAVLFDLDNTLVERDAAFRAFTQAWLGEVAPQHTASQRATLLDEACRRDAHGYTPREPLCAWLGEQCGRSGAELWAAMQARIASFIPPAPAAARLLTDLQARGLAVAIVTNGSGPNQRRKLHAAGLEGLVPDSRLLISAELGLAKPDRRLFEIALERCGHVAPPHALFVGDHPEHDIAPAHALGMRTAWLAHGRAWPLRKVAPDREV